MENAIVAGVFTILGTVITWVSLSFTQNYGNYRNERLRNRNIIISTLKIFILIDTIIETSIKEYKKTKFISNISSEFPDKIYIELMLESLKCSIDNNFIPQNLFSLRGRVNYLHQYLKNSTTNRLKLFSEFTNKNKEIEKGIRIHLADYPEPSYKNYFESKKYFENLINPFE